MSNSILPSHLSFRSQPWLRHHDDCDRCPPTGDEVVCDFCTEGADLAGGDIAACFGSKDEFGNPREEEPCR